MGTTIRYWVRNLPPFGYFVKPFSSLEKFGSVPFHFRSDLVEWKLKLEVSRGDLGIKLDELVEICDEFEEDQLEVFGPQIELDLGTGSSIHDLGEPQQRLLRKCMK